jgi:NAD(P)-dependent dehydrogenase (short-subunit alcohol dehydrogenase family)
MRRQFANSAVLVTGAGSGIGKACAKAFAREGARVAVADIREGEAANTVAEIQQEGGSAIAIGVDVSQSDQVTSRVGAARHRAQQCWGQRQARESWRCR